MANDPGSTPYGIDPASAEAAANQLTSASLTRFGTFPNPQLAFEAFATQSASTLLGAYQQAPQSASTLLTGAPLGTNNAPPQFNPQLAQEQQGLYAFDWKKFWNQDNQQALHSDANAGWKDFGEVPQLNLGYMDGVRNQSDPNRIKAWQHMLVTQGFLDQKAEISGIWDKQTDAAFTSLMIGRAVPEALYSRDPQAQTKARMFLGQSGVDVDSLVSQLGRDPTFSRSIASNWMAAQGPSAHMGDKSELQVYAEQYGRENLPTDWQDLVNSDNIGDAIGGLFNAFGGLPVVGRAANVLGNIYTLNVLHHPGDIAKSYGDIRADEINSNLNGQDQALLANAVSQVRHDTGFLGLYDAYDRLRTRMVLTNNYIFGDVFGGHATGNPFDELQKAWNGSQAHEDNFLAGLVGDQWAQDHPVYSGMANFGANILDDPLTYFGPGLVEKGSTLTMRAGMSVAGREFMDKAIAADLHSVADQASLMRAAYSHQNSHGLIDVFEQLGLHGVDHEEYLTHAANAKALVDTTRTEQEAAALIAKEYPDQFFQSAMWRNAREARDHLSPLMHERYTGSAFKKLRAFGAMNNLDTEIPALTDRVGAAQRMRDLAVTAGMEPKDIKRLLDDFLTVENPGYLQSRVQAFKSELIDHLKNKTFVGKADQTYSGFIQHLNKILNARGVKGGAELQMPEHLFAPTPEASKAAEDLSVGSKIDNQGYLEHQMLVESKKSELEHLLDTAGRLGGEPGTAGYKAARRQFETHEVHSQTVAKMQKDIEDIEGKIKSMERPMPFTSAQLDDTLYLPFTPYDLISYTSPFLRKAEDIQRMLHVDKASLLWKKFTLGKVSSALHIAGGDDLIRGITHHVLTGHIIQAVDELARFFGRAVAIAPGAPGRSERLAKYAEQTAALRKVDWHSILQDVDHRNIYDSFEPGTKGYANALQHQIIAHRETPEIKAWLADPKPETLAKWLMSDHPDAVAMREARRITGPDDPFLQRFAKAQHEFMQSFYEDPELRAVAAAEKFDGDAFAKLIKYRTEHPSLPRTHSRRLSSKAKARTRKELAQAEPAGPEELAPKLPKIGALNNNPAGLLAAMNPTKLPEAVFEHYTKHLVDGTRARMMVHLTKNARKDLDKRLGKTTDLAEMEKRDRLANRRAVNWMRNNTYQMQRSVMGTGLRNVFPFWGATASQVRFFSRVAKAHPMAGGAAVHSMVASERSNSQGASAVTAFGSELGALGFTGGDALQFNPANMFFVSRDGLASFIPGLGPIFSPALSFAAHDQRIASMLSEIPGLAEQMNFQSGQPRPMFPWFSEAAQGALTALDAEGAPVAGGLEGKMEGLGSIGLGYTKEQMQQREDAKLKQMQRADGTGFGAQNLPEARKQVGKDMLVTGLLDFLLPVSPKVTDVSNAKLTKTMDSWRASQTTDQRDQLIADQAGVSKDAWTAALANGTAGQLLQGTSQGSAAPLLAYLDRRAPSELRDQIAHDFPWVVGYSTSTYESSQGVPGNLAVFDEMRNQGNLHLLGGDEYLTRVEKSRQINNGWLQYDQISAYDKQMLLAASNNRKDPNYVAWNSLKQQLVIDLENNYPDWGKQFGTSGRRDLAGLSEGTRALRTLQTWEVIPQHSDMETKSSNLWREALKYRDEAASAIVSVRAQPGHTQAEIQAVLSGLNDRLDTLAQEDPRFAAELGGFSRGKWDDVVLLEAGEQ